MMMMEIQSKANAVKQVGRPVEQYASELQYLWGELDHYAPLQMETPNDAWGVSKWVEDRRVTHFLKDLNPEFENRRAIFCHQESLPTLEEAISAMSNEESRLRVMGTTNPIKSAYVAVDDRECFSCGEKGHLRYNCPNPKNNGGHGGTHGGHSGTRGGHWSHGGGRGGGCGSPSANVASTEETLSVTLIREQLKMWEQWQKGKASETSLDSVTTTCHFGNFANYTNLGEGTQAQALASSYKH
jgi:hypothetical protein